MDLILEEKEKSLKPKEEEEKIEQEIRRLNSAKFVFGLNKKTSSLSSKRTIFENFKNDRELKEEDLVAKGIEPQEIEKMKALREEKKATDLNYRHYDDTRLQFFRSIDQNIMNFNLKENDILNNQEMSAWELPERIEDRIAESEAYVDNLPEAEKLIFDKKPNIDHFDGKKSVH
jgi:hypothetical protein